MSAGLKFSRPVSAIFGSVLGYIICLMASSSFMDSFENFLFLFAHWMSPWAAVLLVHWFTVGKKELKTPPGVTSGFIIFIAVTAASIGLFSANSLFTGLLSPLIGGVDIGPYYRLYRSRRDLLRAVAFRTCGCPQIIRHPPAAVHRDCAPA